MFATLLTLAGVVVFARLGVWQLHRAEQKRALMTQYDAGETRIVDLHNADVGGLPRYQRVRARGHYDPDHQILLDNMPSQQGRAGYRVLTPFVLSNGEWLLVDRGWVAPGATREQLPPVTVNAQERTITGKLDDLPAPGIRLAQAGEQPLRTQWPQVFNFPRSSQLAKALNRVVPARIVLLDPSQSEGYERAWAQSFRLGPERHIAYAVQWFAFAAAALVMYAIISFKPIKSIA